ncbi:MAG: hypothetical protein WA040_22875 [Anaerolineae bacterium]
MPSKKRITIDSPAAYELRLQGRLDQRWSEYLGGVEIRVESAPDEAPVTVVIGRFQDQAALAGALNLLYDLGLPLLSVECLDDPQRRLTPLPALASAALAAQPSG